MNQKRKLLGVQLEVTSLCNFKCKFCPVSVQGDLLAKPQRKFIDPSMPYKIIDAVKDFQLYYFTFSFLGEPMMNPQLFDYISYARKYDLPVLLVTNGTLFKEEHISLINQVDLPRIKISLQIANEEEFKDLRGVPSINYNDYLEKINYILRAKQDNKINSEIYLDFGFNPTYTLRNKVLGLYHGDQFIERNIDKLSCQLKTYLDYLSSKGIRHSFDKLSTPEISKIVYEYWQNYGHVLEEKQLFKLGNGIFISLKAFWDHFCYQNCYPVKTVKCKPDKMVIDIDGDVYICNRDIMKKNVISNIYNRPLGEIIEELFTKIDDVSNGKPFDYCRYCKGYPTKRGVGIYNTYNYLTKMFKKGK